MTGMRDIRKIRKNGWMTEWTDTCMDGCWVEGGILMPYRKKDDWKKGR